MAKVIYFYIFIYSLQIIKAAPIPMAYRVKHGVDTESGNWKVAGVQERYRTGQEDKAFEIAEKGAQVPKAVSDALADAGKLAAVQVKRHLAVKAAEAAEAALAGKEAKVDQLVQEIQEANCFIKDESTSLPDAFKHAHAAVQADTLVGKGVEAVKTYAALYTQKLTNAVVALQAATSQVNEKQKLVEAAKKRLQALKSEYLKARQDVANTKEKAKKAVEAANAAKENASRNRRKVVLASSAEEENAKIVKEQQPMLSNTNVAETKIDATVYVSAVRYDTTCI